MTWNIPLFKIYWNQDDITAVSDIITSGMNWAVGSEITKFEHELADYIGTNYCITFNSGTSALHAAFLAYGIGPRDEVIVPSFTFIATANTPLFVGAKPVFADIEEKTLGLNPESVLEQITPKTKAIVPVHYGGCPCMIKELRDIADDYNLILIEDAAEAFGASIHGKKVGTFGDSAMFSFCQNKIITTGEGGAMFTNSQELYERMKLIRSHGRLETSDYFSSYENMDYISLGYNYRLSNIAASLGRSQLHKVDSLIRMRKEIATQYINMFDEKGLNVSTIDSPEEICNVHQLFSIRVSDRDGLMKHLANNNIMSKIYFSPVHLTHHYQNNLGYRESLPITERVAKDIVSLPIFPGMHIEETRFVVENIANYYL